MYTKRSWSLPNTTKSYYLLHPCTKYIPLSLPNSNNKTTTVPSHPNPKEMVPHPTFFPILKNILKLVWRWLIDVIFQLYYTKY